MSFGRFRRLGPRDIPFFSRGLGQFENGGRDRGCGWLRGHVGLSRDFNLADFRPAPRNVRFLPERLALGQWLSEVGSDEMKLRRGCVG